jgi:uncharacterized membrane protein YedE/YeeE
MELFLLPILGGLLIGAAAVTLLALNGRIAGISGIVGGLLSPKPGDVAWRLAFVAGLVVVGIVAAVVSPEMVTASATRGPVAMAIAGVVVGYGTRLGNGCTSGHGVCGISRGAPRSITATLVFMAAAGATVFFIERALGGAV